MSSYATELMKFKYTYIRNVISINKLNFTSRQISMFWSIFILSCFHCQVIHWYVPFSIRLNDIKHRAISWTFLALGSSGSNNGMQVIYRKAAEKIENRRLGKNVEQRQLVALRCIVQINIAWRHFLWFKSCTSICFG